MNKETRAGSPADRRILWWKDRPIAFACILHPAADGQPLVDGLLLYGGGQYQFTPALETREQTSWDKSKVRAEDRDPMTAVLHLDPSTGWRRADIACRTVVIDGFFTRQQFLTGCPQQPAPFESPPPLESYPRAMTCSTQPPPCGPGSESCRGIPGSPGGW
ncbi:hypothetical protein ACLB9X_33605 [Streptomyces sp. 5K101]|uniref:hypothetical protein n=1 Tax=Streptomyces sp. 5K101 TaxID=3390037 RepID=UPI003976F400